MHLSEALAIRLFKKGGMHFRYDLNSVEMQKTRCAGRSGFCFRNRDGAFYLVSLETTAEVRSPMTLKALIRAAMFSAWK